MTQEIKMPDLGTAVKEVTVVSWLKNEGDTINRGEPLCEVETDKATTELESVAAGTLLRQVVPAGTEVQVGTVIALVGRPGDTSDTIAKPANQSAAGKQPSADEQSVAEKQPVAKVSPMIHNLARRLGIDLEQIIPTGPGGQIVRTDILRAKKAVGPDGTTAGAPVDSTAATAPAASIDSAPAISVAAARAGGSQEMSISKNQLAVARTITQSWREIIPINVFGKIRMASAIDLRRKARQETGSKVSFDAIFVHAVAKMMKQFPLLQCYFANDKLSAAGAVNIGVAVGINDNLFIPVIKNADTRTIEQIESELRQMVDNASRGSLTPSQMSGATFTVSNLGMFAVESFTAIIPPAQSGILTVGSIDDVVAFKDTGLLMAEKQATVILAVDHRFVNGRQAAQYLTCLKEYMENL